MPCRIRENPGLISTEGWKKVRASQYFSTEEPGTCFTQLLHSVSCDPLPPPPPLFKLIFYLSLPSHILYAPAAYVWDAYIWLAPLVWIRGWDSYLAGKLSIHASEKCMTPSLFAFQCSELSRRQGRAVLAVVLLLHSGGGGWARD